MILLWLNITDSFLAQPFSADIGLDALPSTPATSKTKHLIGIQAWIEWIDWPFQFQSDSSKKTDYVLFDRKSVKKTVNHNQLHLLFMLSFVNRYRVIVDPKATQKCRKFLEWHADGMSTKKVFKCLRFIRCRQRAWWCDKCHAVSRSVVRFLSEWIWIWWLESLNMQRDRSRKNIKRKRSALIWCPCLCCCFQDENVFFFEWKPFWN